MNKISKDKTDKNYVVTDFIFKEGHKLYGYLKNMMVNSNNLYNTSNYYIRQVYTSLEKVGVLHKHQMDVLNSIENGLILMNKNQEKVYEKQLKTYLKKKDRENVLLAALKLKDEYKNKEVDEIIELEGLGKLKEPELKYYEMPNENNKFLSYNFLEAFFKCTKNVDYLSLPSQANQAIMKKLYSDWKSFFESIKKYATNPELFKGRPKIPGYKIKNSMNEIVFTNQICKIKDVNGKKILRFPGTSLTLNLSKYHLQIEGSLKEVRAQKYYDCIKLELVFEGSENTESSSVKTDTNTFKRAAALDLGINNLASIVTNLNTTPLLINGKPLKSINNNYNKKRASVYSQLRAGNAPGEGVYTNDILQFIDRKRSLKIKDYLHKASNKITNYLVKNKIEVLYIGKNANWKDDVAMRLPEKQSFKTIPFNMLISQLEYKLSKVNIQVKIVEESYTSKASAIDLDYIPTYKVDDKKAVFSGKRIFRGLYITKNGIKINADINAAYNILRKHFSNELVLNYKVLLTPIKWTPKCAKKKNYHRKKQFNISVSKNKELFNLINYNLVTEKINVA